MEYRIKRQVLDESELKLYVQLQQIAADEFHVIPKLDLSVIVEPDINQWERNSGWLGCVESLQKKRIDFVMFNKLWQPLCAIALIHYDKGQLLDLEMREVLTSAAVPLLVLESNKQYSVEILVQKITEVCA